MTDSKPVDVGSIPTTPAKLTKENIMIAIIATVVILIVILYMVITDKGED